MVAFESASDMVRRGLDPAPGIVEAAFAAHGWKLGGAWCAAWAGLIDLRANGGPGRMYREGYAVSCTRRCGWAHKGSGRDRQGREARPALGPGYAPGVPASVQLGDIVTVGPRRPDGRWIRPFGQHCSTVVAMDDDSVWCIGGNQRGVTLYGEPVGAGVALTRYARGGTDGLVLQHVVTVPDSEYPGLTDAGDGLRAVDAIHTLACHRATPGYPDAMLELATLYAGAPS